MNADLESYAWSAIEDCGCFEDLHALVQQMTDEDISEDCLAIWNEYWSKHQEGCLDCDC